MHDYSVFTQDFEAFAPDKGNFDPKWPLFSWFTPSFS